MKNQSRIRMVYHYIPNYLYQKKVLKEGLIPKTNLLLEMFPPELGPELLKEGLATNHIAGEGYEDVIKEFLSIKREEYVIVTKGLLKPRPKEWEENREFNTKNYTLFNSLLNSVIGFSPLIDDYIPNNYELTLLKFSITQETKAYVIDESHILRIRQIDPRAKMIDKLNIVKRQVTKYIESKIPALEYRIGQHSVPTVCIEDIINSKNIKVEWIKTAKEIKDLNFVL